MPKYAIVLLKRGGFPYFRRNMGRRSDFAKNRICTGKIDKIIHKVCVQNIWGFGQNVKSYFVYAKDKKRCLKKTSRMLK